MMLTNVDILIKLKRLFVRDILKRYLILMDNGLLKNVEIKNYISELQKDIQELHNTTLIN